MARREQLTLAEIMYPPQAGGVACPQCGCRLLTVRNVYRVKSGALHRTKICSNCSSPVYTEEVVREKK